jgi:hypothetical protein
MEIRRPEKNIGLFDYSLYGDEFPHVVRNFSLRKSQNDDVIFKSKSKEEAEKFFEYMVLVEKVDLIVKHLERNLQND